MLNYEIVDSEGQVLALVELYEASTANVACFIISEVNLPEGAVLSVYENVDAPGVFTASYGSTFFTIRPQ